MIHIAILGFGVVGGGVATLLSRNADTIALSAASEVRLKYILDIRDFPDSPFSDKMVRDFSVIEADPDVQVVVETIGGVGAAYNFTKRALLAGKSVVTSNKELVATHGYELLSIAREQNVNYLFEASVGGGIPIIRPLTQCLAANEISEIYGILNGTTNYMLSQMAAKELSFETALKEAQALGYAEPDPSADLQGDDAARKICVLASLGFGEQIYPDQVSTEGIGKVSLADMRYAKSAGWKIKLISRALRLDDGKIVAYVAPHLVRTETSLLANVENVFNGIVVRGNALGDVMFYGAGAGELPTASAVVADVIDCAKHLKARKYIAWGPGGPETTADVSELTFRWYVRRPAGCACQFGAIELLRYDGADSGEMAFLTEPMSYAEIAPKLECAGAYAAFRLLE